MTSAIDIWISVMIIYISLPSYQRNIGHQCGRKMRPTHVEAGIFCQKLSVLILKEGAECWNARYFPIFFSPEKTKCVLSALPPLLSRVYCHRLYFWIIHCMVHWSFSLCVALLRRVVVIFKHSVTKRELRDKTPRRG